MDIDIYLIRHAQTQGNLERRYIGRTDEPLSDAGVACFCNLAYPAVSRVITSPMKRCLQTAQILYPMQEPVVEENFRECDFGDFEGKSHAELENNPAYRRWIALGGSQAPPNGESMEAFKRRCCDAFAAAVQQAFSDRLPGIAFVLHGGTIMAVLERFAVPPKPFYDWQVENLGCWKAKAPEPEWTARPILTDLERFYAGE